MIPTASEHLAGYKLIEKGTLVSFDLVETQIEPSPGGEEMVVRMTADMAQLLRRNASAYLRLGGKIGPHQDTARGGFRGHPMNVNSTRPSGPSWQLAQMPGGEHATAVTLHARIDTRVSPSKPSMCSSASRR
jgi:hypothetical protein